MPTLYKLLFILQALFVASGFREAYRSEQITDTRSAFWTSWRVLTGRTLVPFLLYMMMDDHLSHPHPWLLAPSLDPEQFLHCCAFTFGQFVMVGFLYFLLAAMICTLVAGMSSVLSLPLTAWKPKTGHALAGLICLTQIWMAVSLQLERSLFF